MTDQELIELWLRSVNTSDADRIKALTKERDALTAKLTKAVEALKFIDEDLEASEEARVLKARTTLSEIKGK